MFMIIVHILLKFKKICFLFYFMLTFAEYCFSEWFMDLLRNYDQGLRIIYVSCFEKKFKLNLEFSSIFKISSFNNSTNSKSIDEYNRKLIQKIYNRWNQTNRKIMLKALKHHLFIYSLFMNEKKIIMKFWGKHIKT